MSDIDFLRSITDHCEHFLDMVTHKHPDHIVYLHKLVNNPPQNHFVDINKTVQISKDHFPFTVKMVLPLSHHIVQSDKMFQPPYNHIANLRNMVILCDHFKLEGAALT